MITRVHVRNFGSHKDSKFTLKPLTVFVGPVASRISNIFRALDLLRATVRYAPKDYFREPRVEYNRERTTFAGPIGIEVDVAGIHGYVATYGIDISVDNSGKPLIIHEILQRSGGKIFDRHQNPDIPNHTEESLGHHRTASDPSILYECRPFGSNLVAFHSQCDSEFATELASFLSGIEYYGSEAQMPRVPARAPFRDRIVQDLRDLLREVTGEDLGEIEEKGSSVDLVLRSGERLSASNDHRRILSLLCIIRQPGLRTVCIEEPEKGIHPRNLHWLFDKLVSLAYPPRLETPVQILVSTQVPIDFVKGHSGRIRIVEVA